MGESKYVSNDMIEDYLKRESKNSKIASRILNSRYYQQNGFSIVLSKDVFWFEHHPLSPMPNYIHNYLINRLQKDFGWKYLYDLEKNKII